MDVVGSSQITVPTIIDVPELIVTGDEADYNEDESLTTVWMNKLQFLASTLSYSVGLGNLWRFPHLCYKYSGGAFLIAYTLMFILIGMPLFLMELAFGQYANDGPVTNWRISPAFEGIGYSMGAMSAIVAIYYNVVNSYSLYYFFASITFKQLPFTKCNNNWNTEHCLFNSQDLSNITSSLNLPPNCSPNNITILIKANQSLINSKKAKQFILSKYNSTINEANILLFPEAKNFTLLNNNNNNNSNNNNYQNQLSATQFNQQNLNQNTIVINSLNCSGNLTTNPFEFEKIIEAPEKLAKLPSSEYFNQNMLSLSTSINSITNFNFDLWLCLLIVSAITFTAINKNFRISGKLAIFALITPYLALSSMFMRSLTLSGSFIGLSSLLTPNWSKFKDIDIWADASTQIFFTLAPCLGGVLTMANMNKFHNNFHSDALIISCLNYATSILCSGLTFSVLGHMSDYSEIELQSVVDKGLGLSFVVYSEVLTKMPLPNLSSTLFFAMLVFLGLLSQLSVLELVITIIVDTWPHKLRYRRFLIVILATLFITTIGTLMCFNNGFHALQVLDYFGATYSALMVGFMETIALSWVYGIVNFSQDIDDMIGVHQTSFFPSRTYWAIMWRYLTPSIIFAILIFSLSDLPVLSYFDTDYPDWTIVLGLFLTICCTIFIPAIAILRLILSTNGTFFERVCDLCRPSEDWGPNLFSKNRSLIDNQSIYTSHQVSSGFNAQDHGYNNANDDDDDDDDDDADDIKFVNGKANYIIPEDDLEVGLITAESMF